MAIRITSAARRRVPRLQARWRSGKECRFRLTRRPDACARSRTKPRVPWRTLQTGDQMSFGDVQLTVHHPRRPDWERQRVRNDDSEVLEIRYGGVSFVFTGDIGTGDGVCDRRVVRPGARPDPESAAPRQRHIELDGILRRTAPGHRRDQRRPRQSVRPPGAAGARSLPRHRRRDLPHGSSTAR